MQYPDLKLLEDYENSSLWLNELLRLQLEISLKKKSICNLPKIYSIGLFVLSVLAWGTSFGYLGVIASLGGYSSVLYNEGKDFGAIYPIPLMNSLTKLTDGILGETDKLPKGYVQFCKDTTYLTSRDRIEIQYVALNHSKLIEALDKIESGKKFIHYQERINSFYLNGESCKLHQQLVGKCNKTIDVTSRSKEVIEVVEEVETTPVKPEKKNDKKVIEVETTPVKLKKTNDLDVSDLLVKTLKSFKINTRVVSVVKSSSFLRIKLKPGVGVKLVSIQNRAKDLQVHLGLPTAPLIKPESGYICVDLPRANREVVDFYEHVSLENNNNANIILGLNIEGELVKANLSDPNTCHFLVGGTTGSGKSEFLKSIVLSLIYNNEPDYIKIALVDPKRVTFSEFDGAPWLYNGTIIKEEKDAIKLMDELVQEMELRYVKFEESKCNNLKNYNKKANLKLPRIVCIFDEYADFMVDVKTKKSLEDNTKRLGAKARAAGIHLIISTQRPEAKVVTPIIRSNLPGRIALLTASDADSKIILGGEDSSASELLGKGDLLYKNNNKLVRLQSLYAENIKLPSNDDVLRRLTLSETETLYDFAIEEGYENLEDIKKFIEKVGIKIYNSNIESLKNKFKHPLAKEFKVAHIRYDGLIYKQKVFETYLLSNHKCVMCARKNINKDADEIHHTEYNLRKDKPGDNLYALCKSCHREAHKKENWYRNGVFDSYNTKEYVSKLNEGLEKVHNTSS